MNLDNLTTVAAKTAPKTAAPWLKVGLGVAALALAGAVYVTGHEVFDLLSFKTIGLYYDVLKQHVADRPGLAALAYIGAYAALGVTLLPGSALLAVASGLLFGVGAGIILSSVASALAASLAFGLARTLFGQRVASLSHARFAKFKAGFGRHALSYMMFLRLTPGLSFPGINVISSLIGVPFSTFVFGTIVGLFPSRIALSTAGASFAHVIDGQNAQYRQCLQLHGGASIACPYEMPVASFLTRETLTAFVAVVLLALVPTLIDAAPALWRRFRADTRL